MKLFAVLFSILAWILALVCVSWAAAALFFDLPQPALRVPAAIAFLVVIVFAILRTTGPWKKLAVAFAGFAAVLTWWLQIEPRNDRNWQADVAKTAWAEINGEEFTIHNVRNFEYRTETDYTPRWETRTVRLSNLKGIDLAINFWGSPWIAHPIASFQFADGPPLCFSIEIRRQVGQKYSAIAGLFRQYELIYIVADERDVIRLRTNFRKGEEVFLYRLTATAESARKRFLEYVAALNELHEKPRWYNAVTANCTTAIRTQRAAEKRAPWDWRMLLNGKGDQMLYERGAIVTGGLPFDELRLRALINPAAKAANNAPDFSRRIREGRPGF
jgi:hypothetical protein